MFIPLSTDAPIYHFPWVTVSLIVANVACFVATGAGSEELIEPWILHYGEGLHPVEWVSVNFIHLGILHLIGNMIFLWGFGLVVEGKIGWWRFLCVYFGIAVSRAFIEQSIMLWAEDGASGGASGVIFGLLAVALVWAPKNEVSCIFFLLIRPITFDVTILVFAAIYFALETISIFGGGLRMSSELIHMLGAAVGFGVGVAMLKMRWVDCEGWDLFTVLRGQESVRADFDEYKYGRREPVSWWKMQKPTDPAEFDDAKWSSKPPSPAEVMNSVDELLENKRPQAALAEFERARHFQTDLRLDEARLYAMIAGLLGIRAYSSAQPLMEEFIERFPAASPGVRLSLAGLLVKQRRPRGAIRLLESVGNRLTPGQRKQRDSIQTKAARLIDEGVIELEHGSRDNTRQR